MAATKPCVDVGSGGQCSPKDDVLHLLDVDLGSSKLVQDSGEDPDLVGVTHDKQV